MMKNKINNKIKLTKLVLMSAFLALILISSTVVNAANYVLTMPRVIEKGNTETMRYILDKAEEGDEIGITVTSNGGSTSEAIKLLNSMINSKAHITTVATTWTASAATWLLFAGDTVIVTKGLRFLIHLAYTEGEGPDGLPVKHIMPLSNKGQLHLLRIMDHYYGKYLTDGEINKVLRGKDVTIPGFELKNRIDNCKVNVCKSKLLSTAKDMVKKGLGDKTITVPLRFVQNKKQSSPVITLLKLLSQLRK